MRPLRERWSISWALPVAAVFAATGCEDPAAAGVQLAWTVPAVVGGWTGWPAVSAGTAIVEDGPALLALDLVSGATRWRTVLRQGVSVNAEAITVAHGRVFTAGGDSVYALALASGARLWAFLPSAQAALCQLSADSEAVYVGTRTHVVYALDAGTGAVRWSLDVGPTWLYQAIVVGTMVSGDTVFVSVSQELNASGTQRAGHVFALERRNGNQLWHYTTSGSASDVSGAAAISDGSLLLGDGTGPGFFAIDRNSGQFQWRMLTTTGYLGVLSTPVAADGRVFAGSQSGVYAADLTSGAPAWKRQDMDVLGVRSLAICGGALLVQNQAIRALAVTDGRSLGGAILDGSSAFPTSRVTAEGRYAVVAGTQAIYGLRC